MTQATNLETAKDNLASAIATATASTGASYSIDGQSVSKADYLTSLIAQFNALADAAIIADGPFELHTEGLT